MFFSHFLGWGEEVDSNVSVKEIANTNASPTSSNKNVSFVFLTSTEQMNKRWHEMMTISKDQQRGRDCLWHLRHPCCFFCLAPTSQSNDIHTVHRSQDNWFIRLLTRLMKLQGMDAMNWSHVLSCNWPTSNLTNLTSHNSRLKTDHERITEPSRSLI